MTPVDETLSHSISTLTNWNSALQMITLNVFIISGLIEEIVSTSTHSRTHRLSASLYSQHLSNTCFQTCKCTSCSASHHSVHFLVQILFRSRRRRNFRSLKFKSDESAPPPTSQSTASLHPKSQTGSQPNWLINTSFAVLFSCQRMIKVPLHRNFR